MAESHTFSTNNSSQSPQESGGFSVACSTVGSNYVLAFDTSNETIALGLGRLHPQTCSVEVVAQRKVLAHRASNTQLLPQIDTMLARLGVERSALACVVVGRGPGSFTGVRIAMATAKGMASALGISLIGVSTLDAVAWNAHTAGVRGRLAVIADAMRKEVYPVRYRIGDEGIQRLEADRVIRADAAAEEYRAEALNSAVENDGSKPLSPLQMVGDGLEKYRELFEEAGLVQDENLWAPTGQGLLKCLQRAWQLFEVDPFSAARHNPAFVLPVYTRLSDAEENERIRLAKNDPKNLATGVQEVNLRKDQRATADDTAVLNAKADSRGVVYKPLDAAHVCAVAVLEAEVMGSDAWNERLIADELPRSNRSWWAAYVNDCLIGYAGGWIVDGEVQILKIATHPAWRKNGIARELLSRIACDARDLGASECSLEVRVSNKAAQAFYERMGLRSLGVRPRYYSDGEDAFIMRGELPVITHDVAGMVLQVNAAKRAFVHDEKDEYTGEHGELCSRPRDIKCEQLNCQHRLTCSDNQDQSVKHPLILAIESSCDETAAALVDGDGELISDVVASQIDFHARFGGVVPEIASRKHIEAICGVCDECFDQAAYHLGKQSVRWQDLDAVAVTYAPGLVGALVVGVAFAKAAAWAAQVPFIGVNHMEGHLYANKIGAPDFAPPAVVSLVSGGNTLLVHMRNWGDYETLGSTIDDAVGEAFDKVAKALGLGYPGGPVISQQAAKGNPDAIPFPRAMMHSGDLRFSLSGLKTAVVTYINNEKQAGHALNIPDICASFQQAVVDVQVKKAAMALEQTGASTFCLGGGVAANPVLRQAYEDMCAKRGVRLVLPPLSACGDNAGMIALVAFDRYRQQKFFNLDADACAHADLDKPY